jgi:glycine/D-amino acid oxidase-like deaminating enzyme
MSTKLKPAFRSRAGVTGLTTALLLSKSSRYNIVVAAKHMPGDYDIEYASPWAGANYMPCVKPDRGIATVVDPSQSFNSRDKGCRMG